MEVIRLRQATDSNGNLALSIPTVQKNCMVEIVIVITPDEIKQKKPILEKNFGKLQWEGDALSEQRRLRNECWN